MAEKCYEIFASAVLPDSGAATELGPVLVEDQKFIALYCKYTRGGAAGSVLIKPEYSPDGTNFYQLGRAEEKVITLGADTQNGLQREQFEYKPTDATLQTFIYWVTNPTNPQKINAECIQFQVSEEGNQANPGTFQCTIRTKDK